MGICRAYLIPFLPAIALLAAMLIGFGVRHCLDVKAARQCDGRP